MLPVRFWKPCWPLLDDEVATGVFQAKHYSPRVDPALLSQLRNSTLCLPPPFAGQALQERQRGHSSCQTGDQVRAPGLPDSPETCVVQATNCVQQQTHMHRIGQAHSASTLPPHSLGVGEGGEVGLQDTPPPLALRRCQAEQQRPPASSATAVGSRRMWPQAR